MVPSSHIKWEVSETGNSGGRQSLLPFTRGPICPPYLESRKHTSNLSPNVCDMKTNELVTIEEYGNKNAIR